MGQLTTIQRIVTAQFLLTFILATLGLLVNWVMSYSVLLGGLTCSVPSAFMAFRTRRNTVHPGTALKQIVRGEVGKHLLTIAMFCSIFFWVKPLDVAFYFVALVLVTTCNVFVPLFFKDD